MCTHTYVCTSWRRGTHSLCRLGQSTAAGSAASSVFDASLRATVRPPRAMFGPSLRAPRSAASPPRGAAQRPAQQRSAGTATNAHGGGAGRTGPPRACTGRATRGAPSPSWRGWTCRTRADLLNRPRHARAAPAPPYAYGGGWRAGRTVPPRACTGRATRGAPSPSCRRCTCRAAHAREAAPAAHMDRAWFAFGESVEKNTYTRTYTRVHTRTQMHSKNRYL
jgi:hypothetical protein